MATSMAAVSRRLCNRLYLSTPNASVSRFCRTMVSKSEAGGEGSISQSSSGSSSDSSSDSSSESELESFNPTAPPSAPASDASAAGRKPFFRETVLEDGLDVGIYKAIIVGQIGQAAVRKSSKNGITTVLTTVGTGGIRSERVPFANEEPREYAERSTVQWHRVAVYHPGLASVLMSQGKPGVLVYIEGNLETKIFSDPVTGLVRRIREIAVRRNGRVIFLGGDGSDFKPSDAELRGVGYY